MTYDEFIIEVKRRAQERLGELYRVCLEKVEKNNGVLLDALCMNKREMALSPTLYLNAYYDLYQESMTLDDIMDEILEVYESAACKSTRNALWAMQKPLSRSKRKRNKGEPDTKDKRGAG